MKPAREASVLIACATNSDLGSTVLAARAAKEVFDEYNHNKDFYADMWAFNFNSIRSSKEYRTICFGDVPPNEREQIRRLYKDKFSDKSTAEIYDALGTESTYVCKYSPIEAKWVYMYLQKHRTWEYSEKNTVSSEEICRRLNDKELREYLLLF